MVKKRCNWTSEEPVELIDVMADTNIHVQQKMDGTVHNHKVWKEVAEKLTSDHNTEKCCGTWAYLRRSVAECCAHA